MDRGNAGIPQQGTRHEWGARTKILVASMGHGVCAFLGRRASRRGGRATNQYDYGSSIVRTADGGKGLPTLAGRRESRVLVETVGCLCGAIAARPTDLARGREQSHTSGKEPFGNPFPLDRRRCLDRLGGLFVAARGCSPNVCVKNDLWNVNYCSALFVMIPRLESVFYIGIPPTFFGSLA